MPPENSSVQSSGPGSSLRGGQHVSARSVAVSVVQKRYAPFLHALLDLAHVRVIRAPGEAATLEGPRVEDEAALVDELVWVERIGEDKLRGVMCPGERGRVADRGEKVERVRAGAGARGGAEA